MEMNELRNDDEQLAALLRIAGPRPSLRPDLVRRVRVAAHDVWHEELRRRTRRRAITWASAVAAAVVVAILVLARRQAPVVPPAIAANVQMTHGNTSIHAGQPVEVGAVISTAAESFATLQWSERGSLRIAAGSRLRFTGAGAIQLERGAIYFASAPHGRGVVIGTRLGTVRDAGTAFEVRVEGSALRIRVREGAVEWQRDRLRERAEAGVELLLQDGGVTRRAIPTRGADWNWVLAAAPPIVLDGNARGVLAAIAREQGLTLVFTDQLLADRVNRTSLHDHVPLTPDEALDAATVAADLSYRISGNTLIIERSRKR
jgi:ferric-dicitrate binding protein FerR (iron transport regulator)